MIMKTIKLFLTACLSFTFWGNVLYAQEETPEYKKYEKLAKKVNDIQRTVNGKNVKNDNDDFILKIPERNFIFNYHDFTVSNIQSVANNNTKNGEASMIYENIDLANINDIGILDESFGDCGIIILTPNKKQNYKIVIDDEVHSQESESIVFYFLNSDRAKGKEMFDAISELTFLAKIKKGLLTDKEVRDQIKLWNETKESTDTEKYYSFLKKFPNSIFGLMAKTKAESLDSSVKIFTKDYVGIYLGMKAPIYHKAAKGKFRWGIPLLIVLNVICVMFVLDYARIDNNTHVTSSVVEDNVLRKKKAAQYERLLSYLVVVSTWPVNVPMI